MHCLDRRRVRYCPSFDRLGRRALPSSIGPGGLGRVPVAGDLAPGPTLPDGTGVIGDVPPPAQIGDFDPGGNPVV